MWKVAKLMMINQQPSNACNIFYKIPSLLKTKFELNILNTLKHFTKFVLLLTNDLTHFTNSPFNKVVYLKFASKYILLSVKVSILNFRVSSLLNFLLQINRYLKSNSTNVYWVFTKHWLLYSKYSDWAANHQSSKTPSTFTLSGDYSQTMSII